MPTDNIFLYVKVYITLTNEPVYLFTMADTLKQKQKRHENRMLLTYLILPHVCTLNYTLPQNLRQYMLMHSLVRSKEL